MLKKAKIVFEYSFKSLKFLWKASKEYLLLILIDIILGVVQIFPEMYLMNYTIDFFMQGVEFNYYAKSVGFIIVVKMITIISSKLIKSRLNYVKKVFYTKIQLDIDEICMNVDYVYIQSKAFQENKNFALAAMKKDCLSTFIQSLRSLLSSVLIMASVLYIIASVSLVIVIPLAVSLIMNLYNDYLNARQNFIDTKEDVEYRRKSSYLQNISCNFAYAKEIRMFNLKDRFKQRMDEVERLLFQLREKRRKERRPSAIITYLSEAILDISIYIYLGYKVLVLASITLGQFTLYSNALRQLKNAVDDIICTITSFAINTEYLQGFFDFMELAHRKSEENTEVFRFPQANIQFENVCFRYPNSNVNALENVNITIQANEKLLVVGENGAGKSTFIKLLCGLYRPTSGRILLNGIDVSQIERQQYIRQISAIFQDYNLFAMSIAENVSALGDLEFQRMQDVLSKVDLLDKVSETKTQFGTQLYRIFDDCGVEFSGGEMQRLAIARAIYKDTPILVLDEPTSALDPKTEYEIYNHFKEMARNRTAIYISHRFSSNKFSDKVAVFSSGKIVEYGTHEELIKLDGKYAEMFSLQARLYH